MVGELFGSQRDYISLTGRFSPSIVHCLSTGICFCAALPLATVLHEALPVTHPIENSLQKISVSLIAELFTHLPEGSFTAFLELAVYVDWPFPIDISLSGYQPAGDWLSEGKPCFCPCHKVLQTEVAMVREYDIKTRPSFICAPLVADLYAPSITLVIFKAKLKRGC
jgi:hypothetical protein